MNWDQVTYPFLGKHIYLWTFLWMQVLWEKRQTCILITPFSQMFYYLNHLDKTTKSFIINKRYNAFYDQIFVKKSKTIVVYFVKFSTFSAETPQKNKMCTFFQMPCDISRLKKILWNIGDLIFFFYILLFPYRDQINLWQTLTIRGLND